MGKYTDLFEDSDDLCRQRAAHQKGRTLLSFSCGKDSIGAWLQLRRHFTEIVPVYFYSVPGLEFVEEGVSYFERFFGTRIVRLPHPSFIRFLNNFTFQAPQNCAVIDKVNPPYHWDYTYITNGLQDKFFEGDRNVLTAVGVRAVDSPMRMTAMKKYGPVTLSQFKFMPIYDWNKARLVEELKASGVKLPVDYQMFGRSFDGLDYRFLVEIKRRFPRDYARILEFFPLAELEIFRMECRERYYANR